jgi:hypothetical protein
MLAFSSSAPNPNYLPGPNSVFESSVSRTYVGPALNLALWSWGREVSYRHFDLTKASDRARPPGIRHIRGFIFLSAAADGTALQMQQEDVGVASLSSAKACGFTGAPFRSSLFDFVAAFGVAV